MGGTAESPLVILSHSPDIWGDLEVNLGQGQGIHPANTFLSLIRAGGVEGVS